MRILFEPRTNELAVEASGRELGALAALLENDAGAVYDDCIVARRANEAYSKCLSRIIVDRVESGNVRISVQGDESLVVTGDARTLALLAANIAFAARMPAGEHMHIEHYPGHLWLTEDSYPLVVEKTRDTEGPNQVRSCVRP